MKTISESTILREVWQAVGNRAVIFRLNTGMALAYSGRPVSLGFARPDGKPVSGASDLIGWTPLRVTADMVGHKIAIFTALEIKNSDGGKHRPAQEHFLKRLIIDGGIGGFCNSAEEANKILNDYSLTWTLNQSPKA
jgi:hypothetical protein